MFIKASNYDAAIQKVRIEVGTLVGLKSDDEAFITLKELPTIYMMKLRETAENQKEDMMTFFHDVLPEIIVDHSFYETEQKKMTNGALRDFIFEKISLSTKVLTDYSKSAFFTQRKPNAGK